jgi:D-glycerate 3-kinase
MLENIPIRIFEQLLNGDRCNEADYLLLIADDLTNGDRFFSIQNRGCQPNPPKSKHNHKAQEPIPNNVTSSQLNSSSFSQDLALEVIHQRSQLMQLVYTDVLATLKATNIQLDPPFLLLPLLWHYWLPLAQSLVNQQSQIQRPFIQGLLGGQGTGKTTLGLVLQVILKHLNKSFLSISIDDFYKTYADRQKLRDRRPDLIWRGPPSTHDHDLCLQTLQQLRDRPNGQPDQQPIYTARFDKSLHNGAGDRIAPEICQAADIILFEGWFVGMHPLPVAAFRNLIPPILSERDRQFALQCNADLHNYLPIWQTIDSLIVLVPEDYRYCLQWRIEAEHKLINQSSTGMSDQNITEFVEYFWKALHPELFIPPLINPVINAQDPKLNQYGFPYADCVIKISRSHLPIDVQRIAA